MTTVGFHLDFISPYARLALMRSKEFAAEHDVEWDMRPVVFAALLNAHGLVGPVETEAKRRYTFHDVVRQAQMLGLEFQGPPSHPFRPIEALRVQYLFNREPQAHDLAVRISNGAWGRGLDLADIGVLREIVEEAGLDASDLAVRIAAPEIKQGLRQSTEEAVARGVFGVPTFSIDDEIFWGHDRLDQLAAFLSGDLRSARALAGEVLARPRTASRGKA